MSKFRDKLFCELQAEYGQELNVQPLEDEIPIAAMPMINEKAFFGILKDFVDLQSISCSLYFLEQMKWVSVFVHRKAVRREKRQIIGCLAMSHKE